MSSRVEELFTAAIDLPPEEQHRFLAEACGGDGALQERVQRLLEADNQTDAIPEMSALQIEALHVGRQMAAGSMCRTFGRYRAIEPIGVGGMSVVYKAVPENEPGKIVAVKVLPGGLERTDLAARLEREREILAGLEHPNIARFLDSGTTDEGLPYLVLEYIDGMPLDRFAEELKLNLEERLELFLQVCSAVQFAHANLILHCDLKPNNILVTSDGTPKLLDFGVAKLMGGEGFSQSTMPVMTTEFASPEQVRGKLLTVASDVYSLGVLLYALLSGKRPYNAESRAAAELSKAVCEQDLDLGSCRGLPSDLKSILAMATRKDPRRRYASVERLSADINCYRSRRPVLARGDSFVYRLSVSIRRNRLPFALAMLCFCAVTWGVLVKISEAKRVERRFNQVRGLANFLLFDTFDGVSKLPGSMPLRKAITQEAQRYLDSLATESGEDSSLMLDLGRSYFRLGDLLGGTFVENLGDSQGALASYRKAQDILQQISERDQSNSEANRILCATLQKTGTLLMRQGRLSEARETLDRAMSTAAHLLQSVHVEIGDRYLSAGCSLYAGHILFRTAEQVPSVPNFEAAAKVFRKALQQLSDIGQEGTDRWDSGAGVTYFALSYTQWRMGDLTGDRGYFEDALTNELRGNGLTNALARRHPENHKYRRDVADETNEIGYTLTKLDRLADAETKLRWALSEFEAIAAADATNMEARLDVANATVNLAMCLDRAGRAPESRKFASRALSIYKAISQRDPSNSEAGRGIERSLALGGEHQTEKQ